MPGTTGTPALAQPKEPKRRNRRRQQQRQPTQAEPTAAAQPPAPAAERPATPEPPAASAVPAAPAQPAAEAAEADASEPTLPEPARAGSEARCVCGGLQAQVACRPARVSVCHCIACQQRTGSVFGAQVCFRADVVQFQGKYSQYVRTGDSGAQITSKFCPTCGTTLAWEVSSEGMEGIVVMALGCFASEDRATATFPAPAFSVYEARAQPWALAAIPFDATHWD